jgi:hypothetical protein
MSCVRRKYPNEYTLSLKVKVCLQRNLDIFDMLNDACCYNFLFNAILERKDR